MTTTSAPNSTSEIRRNAASLAGPSATEELPDGAGDRVDLPVRHPGEDREREEVRGQLLRDREFAPPPAEAGIRGRQVRRLRVMAARRDAAPGEKRGERLRPLGPHGVEVPDRLAPFGDRGQPQVADVRQLLAVLRRDLPPLSVPAVE